MIRVKRIYEPPASEDGLRILVDRVWPRGLKKERAKVDFWLKSIAPSTELRKWFAHDPKKWREFCNRYRQELQSKQREVDILRHKIKQGVVTLLFAARDLDHNNAIALKSYLESTKSRRSAGRK
ncbi:MAG TPA: DUF488 domain-containing protein [Xanthobacteraceae bacterium]|nr:DUF488 domain-containing protein [Xanthobacteraceae bacterium]